MNVKTINYTTIQDIIHEITDYYNYIDNNGQSITYGTKNGAPLIFSFLENPDLSNEKIRTFDKISQDVQFLNKAIGYNDCVTCMINTDNECKLVFIRNCIAMENDESQFKRKRLQIPITIKNFFHPLQEEHNFFLFIHECERETTPDIDAIGLVLKESEIQDSKEYFETILNS